MTIAMTAGETTVAVTFILAVAALVLLVVWQLFGLARRSMELRSETRQVKTEHDQRHREIDQ